MGELESIHIKIVSKETTNHAISQKLTISEDSKDILSQALIFAFSIPAQIERSMISNRIKSALNAQKDKGLVMFGKSKGKRKLDERSSEIKGYLKK